MTMGDQGLTPNAGGQRASAATISAREEGTKDTTRREETHARIRPPEEEAECLPGLPEDVTLEILSRLPRNSLFSLRGVSRGWRAVACSPALKAARDANGRMEQWLFALPEMPAGGPFLAFDPSHDTWHALPPMPCCGPDGASHLDGFSCVGVAGMLLVLGGVRRWDGPSGQPARSEVASAVWVFDPATWRWSAGPRMSVARCWCAAAAVKDRYVYVTGGQGRTSFLKSAEVLDMHTGEWGSVSDMRMARCSHRAVVFNDKLTVIAGELQRHDYVDSAAPGVHHSTQNASMETYDEGKGEWTLHPDSWLSSDKVPCPVATVNGTLYAVQHSCVHSYDAQSGSWHSVGDTPKRDGNGRSPNTTGMGCVELHGRLLLLGGSRDVWVNRNRLTEQQLSSVFSWQPHGTPEVSEWSTLRGARHFQSSAHSIMAWKELSAMAQGKGHILAAAVVSV